MRVFLVVLFSWFSNLSFAQEFYLFIGTITDTGSKGIYVYRFNTQTGKAEWVSNTEGIVNPSFLAIAPNQKYIYAVTETGHKENHGNVSAFSFDKSTGTLTFINKQSSGGANPAYITTSKNGQWLITGNYWGGSLSALRTNDDGSIQPLSQLIPHYGKSVNKERQEKSHVHCTRLSPDGKYLFVPDLGIDKVMIYKFRPSSKLPLSAASQPFVASDPGAGPRHITFHPNKKYAYVVEELSGNVIVYKYKKGKLSFIQKIAAHPADFKGTPASADIHVSPDGKFLYASNRGDENNIAIFSVDESTGKLTSVGYEPTGGKTPRNFVIDPTGKYLLVGNQNSGNIVIFKRDEVTGLLSKSTEEIKIPKVYCLKMMSVE